MVWWINKYCTTNMTNIGGWDRVVNRVTVKDSRLPVGPNTMTLEYFGGSIVVLNGANIQELRVGGQVFFILLALLH